MIQSTLKLLASVVMVALIGGSFAFVATLFGPVMIAAGDVAIGVCFMLGLAVVGGIGCIHAVSTIERA